MNGTLSLKATELSFLDYNFNNLLVNLPENRFKSEKLSFRNLTADNISGSFDENLNGTINLNLYKGTGHISFDIEEDTDKFTASYSFKIKNIDIAPLVQDLNEEVYISGIFDIEGAGAFTGTGPEIEVVFNSKPVRGVKQVMNFGAVKVISSLGGASPVKAFGSSDFGYRLIAGRLTIRDGYLTIEGMAGERGGQYLLIRSGIFGGINLSIDKESNTIKIDELQRRITGSLQR